MLVTVQYMQKVCLTLFDCAISFDRTDRIEMATYTFSASTCYALSTHEVSFTGTKITVKLTSTGETVYEKDFSAGLAIMCQNDDFCVGSLTHGGIFTETVDFANRRAKLWLVEQSCQNKFLGSDDENDPNITHKYDLNQCPVQLSASGGVVSLVCPCQNASGLCENDCYTYG